jgi:hypothetical protein
MDPFLESAAALLHDATLAHSLRQKAIPPPSLEPTHSAPQNMFERRTAPSPPPPGFVSGEIEDQAIDFLEKHVLQYQKRSANTNKDRTTPKWAEGTTEKEGRREKKKKEREREREREISLLHLLFLVFLSVRFAVLSRFFLTFRICAMVARVQSHTRYRSYRRVYLSGRRK